LIAGENIPDINCGMRCFQREVIARYLHLLPNGFSASTTSTLLMIKQGYQIGFKIIRTERRVGTSSVSIIKDGLKTLSLLFRIVILFQALRFFTFLSSLQILFAVLYGGYISWTNKLGFPIFASMIFISGVLTFFMGLICDQIVAMRKEKLE
jgi:hypothetical protein